VEFSDDHTETGYIVFRPESKPKNRETMVPTSITDLQLPFFNGCGTQNVFQERNIRLSFDAELFRNGLIAAHLK
jgi:hypothetical protein